jgi:8-oxo-dGTP pyrophosphatase MutT (NUDIX family)
VYIIGDIVLVAIIFVALCIVAVVSGLVYRYRNKVYQRNSRKIYYVAGFLFTNLGTPDESVALIRKNRGPNHMAGKLNGIGGKILPDETAQSAMIREFKEETGVEFYPWIKFCTLSSSRYEVEFFWGHARPDTELISMTDEKVDWYKLRNLPLQLSTFAKIDPLHLVENLRWLIPLALDELVYEAHIKE